MNSFDIWFKTNFPSEQQAKTKHKTLYQIRNKFILRGNFPKHFSVEDLDKLILQKYSHLPDETDEDVYDKHFK